MLPACVPPPPSGATSTEGHGSASAKVGPGLVEKVPGGWLLVEVCADDILRVAYAKEQTFLSRTTLATAPKRCAHTDFTISENNGTKTLTTAKLSARVDLATGAVSFLDRAGRPIVTERARTLTPVSAQGESTNHVRQEWEPNGDESLYGLGQHQQGLMNIKDVDLDLRQYNTEIVIPFLVSSRGYGIFWDNTSFTRFGDLDPAVPLPGVTGLYGAGADREPGDVKADGNEVDWSGTVVAKEAGEYLFRTYSIGDIKVWVNGEPIIDHWRQAWLPGEDIARVRLSAGQTAAVRLRATLDGRKPILRLLWKPPVSHRTTSLWSDVGDGIDYTFVYGPDLDRVIAGYRQLTGRAPMMPRWAFGLWQCRERYRTQEESIEVVDGYRRRGIPLDNIVQDWQYWNPREWGSHQFDPARFPDPAGWIRALHEKNAHLMISVWPKFYRGTANFEALQKAGYLFERNLTENQKDFLGNVYTLYDAFNPAARRLYWSQINEAIFSRGADAWWMDASEPEIVDGPFATISAYVEANKTHLTPTAEGPGGRVLNAFSLVNSQAIYEGQRGAAPDQRVFILTRNGFAGQQRYAAASWSGDITSTWTAMRKQIPAGSSFSLSGMPYWTVDSGGFAVPGRFASQDAAPADLEEWRELNTRWFEYSTFLPLLRVHGQHPHREMWEFGGENSAAFQAELKFDRLRYRLLPYLYSLAGAVTQRGGTILRPLVMDFRDDARAREIGDQYMFGPAFMVSPVTTHLARARDVYLPATAGGWYDFWTGAVAGNGAVVRSPAPLDAIPVHVRAGTLVPMGPDLQYTGEKPADPITVYVYGGADASFAIYEDEGLNYNYEKGMFALIPVRWNDATRTLTIGAREGSFPGMVERRTFQIVLVSAKRPVPFSQRPAVDKTISYAGMPVDVEL
jgi:alpha-D-xyloside xylohydrolase